MSLLFVIAVVFVVVVGCHCLICCCCWWLSSFVLSLLLLLLLFEFGGYSSVDLRAALWASGAALRGFVLFFSVQ